MKKIIITVLIALLIVLTAYSYTHSATTTVRRYDSYVSVCTQYVEGDTIGDAYTLTFNEYLGYGWALYKDTGHYNPLVNKYGQYLLIKSTLY